MTSLIQFTRSTFNILVFIILLSSIGFAQSKSEPSMETQARFHFDKFDFNKSLKLFLTLDSLNPNSNNYNYYLGVCYMNLLQIDQAIPYLEKCLTEPHNYPRNLDYYAAKAYHLSHRFDDAIDHYEIYIEKTKPSKRKHKLVEEVNREIESCKYAKEQLAKPHEIKIYNLGDTINSNFPEYGPVLSADQQTIIFTSGRPNTTGGNIDETDGSYYEDIYISHKSDKGWSIPENLGEVVNTNGHDASISLSPDGQKLLIYRNKENFIRSSVPGDLYITRLKGNTWTQPTQLPEHINTKAWEPSACYSTDEKILFFASSRKGGKGGTDLYMVKQLPNGEWALPMNLGDKINTPYDEDSPFIHPDGKTLYFSSNGHRTIGGFDIFVSKYDEEKREWSRPENIGYPINTAHDDTHFSFTADGRRVYFSSIRPEGKGNNDIYYADIQKEAAKVVVIKGIVMDSTSNEPKEADITVFDNNSNELVGIYNSNSNTGKYIIILKEGRKYNITVEAEGYKLYFENYDTTDLNDFEEVTKNVLINRKR